MGMADAAKPANLKLNVRGNVYNLGEETPRGFPAVLAGTSGHPAPFQQGSGRLEMAEAIVRHPLTARVLVNRIWMHHFGRGIVASPSNFGQVGERPTHPELLDYLAARLVESNWSIKTLHREMMLSSTYQLASENSAANSEADGGNLLYWRANRRRLSAEELRDSLLSAAGNLDPKLGGPAGELTLENRRRTVYAAISRSTLDGFLTLFDFPDATISSEQRTATNVPPQALFFLNSDLIARQSDLLAARLESAGGDADRIRKAYPILYGREVTGAELDLGLTFLREAIVVEKGPSAWQQYAQVLLSSGEFYSVD
jgi:hypothetical protein